MALPAVSLDLALLRAQLPDVVLREGTQVVARVASRGEGDAAALTLAGVLIRASVPGAVRAGQTLRLTVSEIGAERLLLRLDGIEDGQDAAGALVAQPPAAPARPADPDARGDGARAAREATGVALRYETPALGRLDLRVDRTGDGAVVTVVAAAGGLAAAQAGAEALRKALEERLGAPASVRVLGRRDPFDAYA